MATATIQKQPATYKAEIIKVPVPQPDLVVLTLTRSEADTLRAIGFRTGGDPSYTRRGDIDAITKALSAAGIPLNKAAAAEINQGLHFTTRAECSPVLSGGAQGAGTSPNQGAQSIQWDAYLASLGGAKIPGRYR